MRKYFAILFILLAGSLPALSQQYYATLNIDSLKKILLTAKDTQRVNILNLLARRFLYGERTKTNRVYAQKYAGEALPLARDLHYNKGLGNALLNEGILLNDKGFTSLKTALPLLHQAGDEYAVAACFKSIADCYHTLGENKTAILFYDSAQNLSMKLGDTSAAAWNMSWIGHLNFDLGNYVEAFKTGQAAWELAKETDTLLQTLTLAHLANLFLGAGLPEMTIQYLHKILLYYPGLMMQKQAEVNWPLTWALERGGQAFLQLNQVDSAQKIAQVLNIPFEQQDNTNHLFNGLLYAALHQYERALPHFKQGYLAAKKQAYPISLTSHAGELGRTYLAMKDFTKAIYYTEEALRAAQKIHALLEMKNAAGTLVEIYDQANMYSKAYHYSKLYKSLNDSLAPEEYRRKLSLMQIQNELEIQKQQAQLLSKDNLIKNQQIKSESFLRKILIGGILSFLLLGFIIFRNIILKRKNESNLREIAENELQLQKSESEITKAELEKHATELEMQALRAQMNPHFIFNCLSSINRFILKNESQPASDYLTKFSRLIRMVLTNSKKSFIALEDELEMLRLYLEMERLRFQYSFEYKISFKNEIDPENIFIPPLLLQPFAENAIWHGLMHKQGQGHLEIALSLEKKILTCMITDNGIGRNNAARIKSKSAEKQKSMGLQITTERLALLNQDMDVQTFFNIEDITDDEGNAAGTRVILKIHYKDLMESFA